MSFIIAPITVNLATNVTGTLPVKNGGTGLATLTANSAILGNGLLAVQLVAPGIANNLLTSDGTTWNSVAGAAGGVAWTTKTTTYTAVSGDYLLCDTSAGAFTITMPASPILNDAIYFQDAKGTFGTNALTINVGAKTVNGESGNLISTLPNAGFGLVYNGTEWRIF